MKLRNILIFFILIFYIHSSGQISVSQTGTVAQWVQNVLIGPGISVSNVSYTGDPLSIGTFTTGTNATNLGFPAGIIMTSGKASNAIGPNNTGSVSYNSLGGSDANLAASINTTTSNVKDACVLEFDFVPVSDTVKFRYVFGSDEYAEFVGSSYNDVFGFFISGLNPYGGFYTNVNIAKIPNTSTPVSINNVNNGTTNTGPCMNCAYYTNNTGGQWIQYDGMTVVLTAWIKVIPCFTYHIKLAIADVGDEAYDSGVFLEANSFMSNSVVIDQSTSNTIDTSAIEGCNDAIITFRIPHPISTSTIINYLPLGTATNGVDYTLIGTQAIIPAGQDSVNLIIHPIYDGIPEPTEYIKLIVNTSSCTYDTVYIYIKDNDFVKPVLPNDTVLCGNSSVTLDVNTTGGFAPYTYVWSTQDTTKSIYVSPTLSTLYSVTVTDLCSNDSTVSMWVKVSEPDFSVTNDTICDGENATVSINPNIPLSYDWQMGSNSAFILVSPNQNSVYQVRVTDTLGCFVDTSAYVIVNPLPVITVSPDISLCKGESAVLTAQGGINYLWNSGDTGSIINITPNFTSTYTVTVENSYSCFDQESIYVEVLQVPNAEITTSIDTLCKGSTAELIVSGADNYIWNTGSTSGSISITPIESSNYYAIASYSNASKNCSDTAYFTQPVKRCNRFYIANAFTPNDDGLNDFFTLKGVFSNIDHYEMIIFDRWGRQIYYSQDINKPWDGAIDGEKAPVGLYGYKIVIRETFSEEYNLIGTVHLLK